MFIVSKKFILFSIFIAIIYILVATYLMNFELIKNTLLGNFPMIYKLKILFALLGGMWTAMTHTSLSILILTALLTGVNTIFVVSRLSTMSNSRNLHFVAGGSSLLGIIGSGCAVCGLPIVSLLGLGGSIAYLPFHGIEISYIALFLLFLSTYTFVKTSKMTVEECSIRETKSERRIKFSMKEATI